MTDNMTEQLKQAAKRLLAALDHAEAGDKNGGLGPGYQNGYGIEVGTELAAARVALRALTTSQPAQAGEVDERVAFEKWAKARGYDTGRDAVGGSYSYGDTHQAWFVWKGARASLPTQPAAQATQVSECGLTECLGKPMCGYCCKQATPPQQAAGEPVGIVDLPRGYPVIGKLGDICSIRANEVRRGDILYTHPAPAVPEGFALVPVEPTISMLMAGDESRLSMEHPSRASAVWAAMLAAAQAKGGEHE